MDKDGFYISYSPCSVFSEFVGENQTSYIPCIKASVSLILLRKINLLLFSCNLPP